MEKDKFRSVITVGMLVCSVLVLSALIMSCGPSQQASTASKVPGNTALQESVKLTRIGTTTCAHPVQAEYYHHTYTIPPHLENYATVTWFKSPPPGDSTSHPAAQPCPVDGVICDRDSLKCTVCGARL